MRSEKAVTTQTSLKLPMSMHATVVVSGTISHEQNSPLSYSQPVEFYRLRGSLLYSVFLIPQILSYNYIYLVKAVNTIKTLCGLIG